jgi:hypothetical protein
MKVNLLADMTAHALHGSRAAKKPTDKNNRQANLIAAIGADSVTERQILDRVGDNRYSREILRKLTAMSVVQRTGRGGSNDPYRYYVSNIQDLDDPCILDPILERRMKKIESKIIKSLSEENASVTRSERYIRDVVGDNTGTGKALRRMVQSAKVSSTTNISTMTAPEE